MYHNLLIALFIITVNAVSQQDLEFSSKVYEYLVQARGGKHVNYSPNLAKVAQMHAEDLAAHHNIKQSYCKMHSWYTSGDTNCCYTEDHSQGKCMWDKPKQFSNYKENGYEVAFYGKGKGIGPKQVIDSFLGSKGHRVVILNQGIWDKEWKACGVGHSGYYTTIWFGNEIDSEANGKFKYPTYDEIDQPKDNNPKYQIPPVAKAEQNKVKDPSSASIPKVAPTSPASIPGGPSYPTNTPSASSPITPTPTKSTCPQPTFRRQDFKGDIWYKQGKEWKYLPPLNFIMANDKEGYFKAADSFKSSFTYSF